MRRALSILLRIAWLAWVCLAGAMGILAVAFGFSGGLHWISFVLLAIFLVTFVPALIVAFLPWPRLRHPSLPLKLWYGWVAVWLCIYLLFGGYHAVRNGASRSSVALDAWLHPDDYATLCWRGGPGADGIGIVFWLGNATRVAAEFAKPTRNCRRYRLDEAPQQVVLLANEANRLIPVLDIPKVAGGRTCFVVEYDGTMRTPFHKGWRARLERCADAD